MRKAVHRVERHGEAYYQGNRHTYLMKCVSMMNRLGVSQQEAEQWTLTFDLGEREIRTLVKSVYSLYAAQHGTFSVPEWTKTKTLTKTGNFADAKFAPSNFQTFNTSSTSHAHTRACESDVTELKVNSLPDYQWPRFIQQMVDCGDSKEQRDSFNQYFSMLFHHAGATRHNHHMKSSVAREAINVLRMMSVVAFNLKNGT